MLETNFSFYVTVFQQSTLSCVINHNQVDSHINVSEGVRSLLHTLNNLDVDVTLGLIPGHSHIYYNDLVDSKAQTAAKDAYNIPPSAELTTQTCKKLISKQCQSAWQQRWDRSQVARSTYDLLPLVGKKLVFPSDCCCAISYVRYQNLLRIA